MLPVYRHRLPFPRLVRRAISSALVVIYFVVAAGVPLPGGSQPHDLSEDYPCAHCACGCGSAEQCWRSCCCHTLAERMAWAREHNVRPPEYAIAEARSAGVDLAWLESGKRPACCEQNVTSQLPPCCQA